MKLFSTVVNNIVRSNHVVRVAGFHSSTQSLLLVSKIVRTNLFDNLNRCPIRSQFALRFQGYAKPTKGSGGGKKITGKKALDDLLDGLDSDDEDVEDDAVVKKVETHFNETPASRFINGKTNTMAKSGKKDHKVEKVKNKGSHFTSITYSEAKVLLNVDMYWEEMENVCKAQQDFFAYQLTLRSASSLDDLPVEFEGDSYPIRELAEISKKDPKRLVIDTSAFPQATSSIMKTLTKNSGLNLNPQQDGTRIYVPIPKVTREHRENLSKGARTKCNETKESLRKVQSKYVKLLKDKELVGNISVPKSHFSSLNDLLLSITDHFVLEAEAMLQRKQKDLMA